MLVQVGEQPSALLTLDRSGPETASTIPPEQSVE